MRPASLGRGGRFLAACLAGTWLMAGLAAVGVGVWVRPSALPICLGLLAMGYGFVWLRVAITGHRQDWPLWNRTRTGGRR